MTTPKTTKKPAKAPAKKPVKKALTAKQLVAGIASYTKKLGVLLAKPTTK